MAHISIVISILSLCLSGVIAWLTLFSRGTLRLTRPAFIAFCYDIGRNHAPLPKIFIRALLYSTGKRGHVVENMFLIVRRNHEREVFNIWGHGDEKLSRGSGLFVGETGIVCNHHFNPASESASFAFLPGRYEIQVFATLPGQRSPICLHTLTLEVQDSAKLSRQNPDASVWFDWHPNENRYDSHLETRKTTLP
jgi:hypothetical protein